MTLYILPGQKKSSLIYPTTSHGSGAQLMTSADMSNAMVIEIDMLLQLWRRFKTYIGNLVNMRVSELQQLH